MAFEVQARAVDPTATLPAVRIVDPIAEPPHEGTRWSFRGRIANDGDVPLRFTRVILFGVSAEGRTLGEQTTYADVEILGAGLYDATFAASFQPTEDDLRYSVMHPTLAAAGAVDGVLPSGLAIDDDDPLSRRDQGLEFLDVTAQAAMSVSTMGSTDTWVITNTSDSVIVFLPEGVLEPGASIAVDVLRNGGSSDSYQLRLLSGQGKP